MKTLTYPDTPHNLGQLSGELVAGVPSLAPVGGTAVFMLSGDGIDLEIQVPDETPNAEVDAVVEAHVPQPIPPPITEFLRSVLVDAQIRTTDDQPHEVFRFPTEQLRRYRADLIINGIDAGNFVSKVMEGRFVWKRTTGANALMVGITVVSDIGDPAAAAWAPNALPQGADIVFTVKGAAGRTIDWLLTGTVDVYAPGGLTAQEGLD